MFTANFNTSYTDANGAEVATGYANLGTTVDINLSIKDKTYYDAHKDDMAMQEAAFRAKVLQIADIMGVAEKTPVVASTDTK